MAWTLKGLRLAAWVAVIATIIVSGCAGGTTTITGTLVGSDGSCLYIDVPDPSGTVRYWLRNVPSEYSENEDGGLVKPDGSVIALGDSLTVSGTLAWLPFDRRCAGTNTLDATAVN